MKNATPVSLNSEMNVLLSEGRTVRNMIGASDVPGQREPAQPERAARIQIACLLTERMPELKISVR